VAVKKQSPHDHEKKDKPIMLFSSGVDKLGDDSDQVLLSVILPNNSNNSE